jgi:pantoate--beta-alanine ligase
MPRKSKSVAKRHTRPQVIRAVASMRAFVSRARRKSETLALVPTMGALHKGHLELVRLARRRADRVVVSIFVNPTQFAPNEDFSSYPRTWDTDLAALSELSVDAVWAPGLATMYPDGFATAITPGGPALAGLEDRFRRHFFGGVCTVVAKLLLQVAPDFAIFGEKDYQQLQVVTRLAQDLDLPLKVVGMPTIREPDGLALSSRNAYLTPQERETAPTLFRVLTACAERISSGGAIPAAIGEGGREIAQAGFALDYLEARHAETLMPIASPQDGPIRLLVAARIGKTRLIDNIAV